MVRIFLVDDDPFFGEMLKYHLELNPDYEVFLYSSGRECLSELYRNPDIICIDFGLPDIQGDDLFKQIKGIYPSLPIIVISGQENISVAIDFLKQGAKDYIVKNEHTKELLWNSIIRLRENISLKQEVEELKDELEKKYSFEKTIIGQSESIKNIFSKINKALKSNINVSVTGETGTGKEVVARAIHYHSSRKNKPFVAVNMAAIPKDLVESEFFGHEKGAFTGATDKSVGKFEQANGGTIFLDEIAELDLNLQSKLLRALQEREITRVGGTQKIKLDVRLIIATHKNLANEVKKGNFREDLYYRVIGLPIELPPLRERDQDTLILAKHFIDLFAKENKIKPLSLSSDARKKLMKYSFPGNIRELKSVVDLACVMAEGNEITADDISFYSLEKESEVFLSEQKTLKQYTTDIILHFLKENNNDVIKTAKILDIGKSTVYNLINSVDLKKTKE
ncbi:MAG: sigma-54-dependent Fis family transcriptional regulator [Chlorobi bacterium]|jgi:DNA-binding NtrC family response regulator|uniref:Sigma-54 dependent transcriptional regulator n=2 Tax=Chryseobacterium TaxID=59732 RepID=A0AAJ1R073_9FLAO|nr:MULTISPECIES: sigma-54 dependent transcriptional regulator [Chryseobacterium]NPA08580.1 sigma-54-dependent Fis family transcriptional regulator [Chlorobiota bacterium]MCF2219345.1 sigma-54 dependent transcriptional regulator [Chryseobacterium sp. PS-8]MDN4010948.1 sigma-54 dependent transcriptional regulator [Chryseobacterium gambrini]MDN4028438.1 sigma-54 dependent transcriptional regulator [Chryseobacterium gambrini]QWA38924.1 sigma-54 dependent transcriptional regulator [Chryseobacterium